MAGQYGYALQNPGRNIDPEGLAQGDRGDFDRKRNRDGDPFINGVLSLPRGLVRCSKHCNADNAEAGIVAAQELLANDKLRQCVMSVAKHHFQSSANRQYFVGRVSAGAAASAVTRGYASPLVGVAALGDASYAAEIGRSVSGIISATVTGDPDALAEEAICQCIERFGD